jgi:hypothetical protein
MEDLLASNLFKGVVDLFNMVNWLFVVVYMLSMWLINEYTDSNKKGKKLNRVRLVPKFARVVIWGALLAGFFFWAFRYDTREDVVELFFSILVSMLIYRLGIRKIFDWLSPRVLKTK